jgi:hypothetical protein
VVSDALKAWCSKLLQRRLEGKGASKDEASNPAEAEITTPPPEPYVPIDQLYRTIARFRRGGSS